MRKKVIVLVTACVIIAVVASFEFWALRTPTQPITSLNAITSDPSAWVNRTVTVEGDLGSLNIFGYYPIESNPIGSVGWMAVNLLLGSRVAPFVLVSGIQNIGVSLNPSLNGNDFLKQYNGSLAVMINGVVEKGESTVTGGTFNLEQHTVNMTTTIRAFYYIEAQRLVLEKE
jgi:hypothetical protein